MKKQYALLFKGEVFGTRHEALEFAQTLLHDFEIHDEDVYLAEVVSLSNLKVVLVVKEEVA